MARLNRIFYRVVLSRRWLCFVVLCASFGLFGAGTLNLFNMFSANWDLITNHGTMALLDGAAQQLFELLLTLVVSMLNYVIFKACEHSLVHVLTDPTNASPDKDTHP